VKAFTQRAGVIPNVRRQNFTVPLLTNQVGIPDAVLTRGGGMYISLGLLVLIILLVVLLR
jgi:hypothetical protein